MYTLDLKAIPCRIYRGALSSERVFEISLSDDERYESTAPRLQLWNRDGEKLGKHEPSSHEPIEGFVAATILERAGSERVLVHLPDDETVVIDEWRLVERPEEVGVDMAPAFA